MAFPETPELPEIRQWSPQFQQLVEQRPKAVARPRRLWLHALLLLLTMLSTAAVGARMQFNFDHGLPFFDVDRDFDAFWSWWQAPSVLAAGLPFSLTLLLILLAHEFGHYLACLYYGIDASLPYFLPAPTFTGTFGAFIRIRSPIYSRKQLFDVGVAGPIAGFVFLLPVAGVGLAFSKVIPGIADMGSLHFGTPPLLRVLEMLIFPGTPVSDIYLNPVVRAAWVGIFATALNLLPAGQLDGGHIVYALFGRGHKWFTYAVIAALAVIGKFWWGWWCWAAVLFLLARRHPPIYDLSSVGATRWRLGILAFVLFALCFSLAPVNQ